MKKTKIAAPRTTRVADLAPGQYADGSPLDDIQYLVALWRTRGEHTPLVGEFAFQVEFMRRADVHDKARARCAQFFIRLQQIAQSWIYPGATKTGMVYRLKGNPPQAHE